MLWDLCHVVLLPKLGVIPGKVPLLVHIFIQDLQPIAQNILTLQDQINSLATTVLQNQQGLDLLPVEKGGLGFFLREECCF